MFQFYYTRNVELAYLLTRKKKKKNLENTLSISKVPNKQEKIVMQIHQEFA